MDKISTNYLAAFNMLRTANWNIEFKVVKLKQWFLKQQVINFIDDKQFVIQMILDEFNCIYIEINIKNFLHKWILASFYISKQLLWILMSKTRDV